VLRQTFRQLPDISHGFLSQALITVQPNPGQIKQLPNRLRSDAFQRVQQPGTEP
jgi:hypothetical protein